jgi:hypothetical protein
MAAAEEVLTISPGLLLYVILLTDINAIGCLIHFFLFGTYSDWGSTS